MGKSSVETPWADPWRVDHAQLLLDSFERLLGRELMPGDGSVEDRAKRLFHAPFVVVSHGIESDPVLNYGNRVALELWEMDFESFVQTPSRLTAEPVHRDERARLLSRTAELGYVDDYSGIRISRTGRRFRIERAIVWNVIDEGDRLHGQAATFDHWTPVLPSPPTDAA